METSHGYQVKDNDDEWVETAERVAAEGSEASDPSAHFVDYIPACACAVADHIILSRFLTVAISEIHTVMVSRHEVEEESRRAPQLARVLCRLFTRMG